MWSESMRQCKCKSERITYDDFRLLMKGQRRETMTGQRRGSLIWGNTSEMLHLSEITESGIEEETEEEMALSSSSEESYDSSGQRKSKPGARSKNAIFRRKRSRSFDDSHHNASKKWFIDDEEGPRKGRRPSLPPKLCPISTPKGEIVKVLANDAKTPLMVNRTQYLKHRDLRVAVVEASKSFDIKCQERSQQGLGSPGLIMKRGDMTPSHLEDAHQKALFDAAVRRCGRLSLCRSTHDSPAGGGRRQRRKKTVSDMTGMITATLQ